MCYSAQIQQDYREYVRLYGANISLDDFVRLYWRRKQSSKLKIPKGMDAAFASPENEEARAIKALIDEFNQLQVIQLEQEIFKQRKRLADAERSLQAKPTKAASESRRIAIDKVAWGLGKLADLRRTSPEPRDDRLFPGSYVPVMIAEHGQRVIKPMRYQCRPAGKPASYDTQYPGCYNARRDNLRGFWKGQFGHSHGLVVMSAFYENVSRHRAEGRELSPGEKEESMVLEFRPEPAQDLLVACLWSHWQNPGEEGLLSFAIITDDPPAEVSAAGHDRCVIPIKVENADIWLNPDPSDLDRQFAVLDDRHRPYYSHRKAA